MAGDWIKVRVGLIDDPDVYVMSDLLSLEVPTIVGHLLTFWGWMDRHSVDGEGIKLTDSAIDNRIGVPGFSAALREVGWLDGDPMALFIPHWDRHNSASAKARSLEAEAKRIRRSMGKNESDEMSDKKPKKSRTREEKRREESIHSSASAQRTPTQKIVDLYNSTCTNLPTSRVTSDATKTNIGARWKQDEKFQKQEFWEELFQYCNTNDFLSGRVQTNGDKPWRASLDWIVRPSNFSKIINGNYESQSSSQSSAA